MVGMKWDTLSVQNILWISNITCWNENILDKLIYISCLIKAEFTCFFVPLYCGYMEIKNYIFMALTAFLMDNSVLYDLFIFLFLTLTPCSLFLVLLVSVILSVCWAWSYLQVMSAILSAWVSLLDIYLADFLTAVRFMIKNHLLSWDHLWLTYLIWRPSHFYPLSFLLFL